MNVTKVSAVMLAVGTVSILSSPVDAKASDRLVDMSPNFEEPCMMKSVGSSHQKFINPVDGCGDDGDIDPSPIKAPSIPQSLDYFAFSVAHNKLNWQASNGFGFPVEYRVEERKNNGVWNLIYSGFQRNLELSNKSSGKYQYRVQGCNEKGCSQFTLGQTMKVENQTVIDYSSVYAGLEESRQDDHLFLNNTVKYKDGNIENSARRTTKDLTHNIGKGYGLTEGKHSPEEVCLQPSDLYVDINGVNTTTLSFDQIESRKELYERLNLDISGSLSASIGVVDIEANAKYSLFRESNMLQDNSIVLGKWEFQAERMELQSSKPKRLKNYWINQYINPNDGTTIPETHFRNQCGDKYTNSVVTGARIYLLLQINNEHYDSSEMKEISGDLKVKVDNLFSVDADVAISTETRTLFDKHQVSLKVVTEGADANDLVVHSVSLDNVREFFNNIIIGMKPDNHVALFKGFEHYPIPVEYNTLAYYDVFKDYQPIKDKLDRWITLDNEVHNRCHGMAVAQSTNIQYCNSAFMNLGSKVAECATGETWSQCESPFNASYDDKDVITQIDYTDKFYHEILSLYAVDSPYYSTSFLDLSLAKPGWLGGAKTAEDTAKACLPKSCIADHAFQYQDSDGPAGTIAIPGSYLYVDEYRAHESSANYYEQPQSDGQVCLISNVWIKNRGWPNRESAVYKGRQSFHGLCPKKSPFRL